MVLIAVICFALAAFGVPSLGFVSLVPFGLAFWAGSQLVS